MDKQDDLDATERRSARWFRKSDLPGFVPAASSGSACLQHCRAAPA